MSIRGPFWDAHPAAARVALALQAGGVPVRAVGGSVRDWVRGVPAADVDLAADADVSSMIEITSKAGIRPFGAVTKALAKGGGTGGWLRHGTVPFLAGGDMPVEVTRLAGGPSRDPFREDAAHRDFTMNAMSVGLDGVLHDHFGGETDLARDVVRFTGDPLARLTEDPVRAIRFFRFRGQCLSQTPVDNAASAALKACAPALRRQAGERLWLEFRKVLGTRRGVRQIADMAACGVLEHVAPHLGTPGSGRLKLAATSASHGAGPALVLGLLLPSPDAATLIADRLRMSGADRGTLAFASRYAHLAAEHAGAFRAPASRSAADHARAVALLRALGRDADALRLDEDRPTFPLRGRDIAGFGLEGERLGAALKALEDAWRSGGCVESRESLISRTVANGPVAPRVPVP